MNEATLTGLTWLVPAGPLLAFLIIILFTRRFRTLSWVLAWAGVLTSVVLGWTISFKLFSMDTHQLASHPVVVKDSINWLSFGAMEQAADGSTACALCTKMGVAVDPLSALMLFFVPFAVLMIFIYSVGYHNYGKPKGKVLGVPNHGQEEPLFSRFFAFMSLFAGAMLTLVVSDNLLLLFVGWEIMGLCSYLLIGFWYARTYEKDPKNLQKLAPRWAAVKAFMTTRVADVVMLVGIVFFYMVFGTLNFSEAFSAESLMHAADSTFFGAPGGVVLGIVALLIFAGTVGKSAQWPLHVWLPNAMEGPTPVSAVIHAAAMVSAGIYLILRIFPLIAVGSNFNSTTGLVIGGIGAFTALMAATIAVAQDDVKGVLAYSTISQLGFMVAAVGIGAYIAAAFHLMTHAFFKALLFLSSGSVIHGMEHGAEHVHDHHTDPQDMINMGGLRKKMPITFWGFLIGGLALSGFPLVTAGFWSKDEIFADAWMLGKNGSSLAMFVFIMLAIAAFLTAFYTARQISLTFLGKPRTPLAEHAHESNRFMTIPLIALSFFAITAGWVGIPEDFPVIGPIINNNAFHHFVGATLEESFDELYLGQVGSAEGEHEAAAATHEAVTTTEHETAVTTEHETAVTTEHEVATTTEHGDETATHTAGAAGDHGGVYIAHRLEAPPVEAVPLAASLIVALGGLGLGYWIYGRKPLEAGQPDPLVRALGPLHTFLQNKWYWDELYQVVFIKPVIFFSETVVYTIMDKGIIDGILHFVANTASAISKVAGTVENFVFNDVVDAVKDAFFWVARESRGLQTGKIQEYVLVSTLLAGALTFFILYIGGVINF